MELKPKEKISSPRIQYEEEFYMNRDLIDVCSTKPSSEIILLAAEDLLKKGANPNYKDEHGNSPIILAIRNNNSKLVELLLYRGATIPEDVEIRSKKIKSIIHNWPTTMGLLATQKLGLEPNNVMDLSEYLDTRVAKGKKRKSNKNKRKSNKNKKRSTKIRK
jgi:ankyrin repeat protein